MRIEEKALILPTLYIINREGSVSMTELIRELTSFFDPDGEDAAILRGRSDTKFSQKVRNLKSHRDSNGMEGWTAITSTGKYIITPAGLTYLNENIEQVEYLFSNKFKYEDILSAITDINIVQGKKKKVFVYTENDMVSEGKATIKENIIKKRSRKLRMAAIERYKDANGKLYCVICGFCFENRYGDIGKDFIEMHHESPVYQYSDDGFESYIGEAVKKIKPVCPNCHRMIHRDVKKPLSISELKKRLK